MWPTQSQMPNAHAFMT
jgi:hypothetical protein